MNADPRRPEKIQRFVRKTTANGEDLTPDYMNILGQQPTTANAGGEDVASTDHHHRHNLPLPPEEYQPSTDDLVVSSNATNVIPTSPQYGVAIIPNSTLVAPTAAAAGDIPAETIAHPTETVTDTTKVVPDEGKDVHSTPSRNERFKVVKIASLEPFKRGRWKCMDYVDEAPPPNIQTKATQSSGSIQVAAGGVYLQTQSLPQQQIQQMLLQSGFANGGQFFSNVPTQMMPQTQYFYPQVANLNQTVPQQVPSSMPAQFINNQPYFPAGVVPNAAGFTMPQSYPNVQYVPANLIANQNSAFVPTSQIPAANFQQSQTYAGQANVSQSNVQQPVVNGHFTQPSGDQGSVPTQTAKTVVNSQPVVSQSQIAQPVPVLPTQQYQQQQSNAGFPPQTSQVAAAAAVIPVAVPPSQSQNFEQNLPSNVYTNPQFGMGVNSLTVLENETASEVNETNSVNENASENADDPAKTNPVVNAIDNKIEQAMDLVKSHLMYTVREEVEVLKEKIAELMERIQQLETENNFLRSLVPKTQQQATPPTSTVALVNTTTTTGQASVATATTVSPIVNAAVSNSGSQTCAAVSNATSQNVTTTTTTDASSAIQ